MSARVLGRLLRGVRAGESHLVWNDAVSAIADMAITTLMLMSPAFEAGGAIPPRHAGKGVGDNISPALTWSGVPTGAKELVVVVEDPDAPLPRPFVHAIAFAISPSLTTLPEGALSLPAPTTLSLGKNSWGGTRYAGPRPIPGHGPHAYVFQIFATSRPLSLAAGSSRRQLVAAMRGTVIARGRLNGFYER
jgi:Raf kinase inhibitor-like YbhB/YbcL family protein